MTISPVGNNFSTIVELGPILTILTCLVDYDHVSGDIGQINLDIFRFLKGTTVWSDSVVK